MVLSVDELDASKHIMLVCFALYSVFVVFAVRYP